MLPVAPGRRARVTAPGHGHHEVPPGPVTRLLLAAAEASWSVDAWVADAGVRRRSQSVVAAPAGRHHRGAQLSPTATGRHAATAAVPRHAAVTVAPRARSAPGPVLPWRPVIQSVAAVTVVVLVLLTALVVLRPGVPLDQASGQVVGGPGTVPASASHTPPPPSTSGSTSEPPSSTTGSAAATSLLLAESSSTGNGSLAPFTAPGAWRLQYQFDCGNIGRAGTFAVTTGTETIARGSGYVGDDTITVPDPGTHVLQVVSSCGWSVRVLTAA